MAQKNSFVTLSQKILKLNGNALSVMASLNDVTNSNDDEVSVDILDENDQPTTISFPSVGFLKSEIQRLEQNMKTLSSVDQRGAIIEPSRNEYKKIITVDLNREPNPIPELDTIQSFIAEKNHFFDALLNPILKVSMDLSDKIENNTRKILSKRYIINFEKDAEGNITENAQTSIDLFNETFKNRTDISIEELEIWIKNTPNIVENIRTKTKIDFDLQEFILEPNKVQNEGFFTILGSEEDTINKKLWYQIDTLDYYEIDTKQKKQLQLSDEIIINVERSSTRYKVIEIDKNASEIRIRFERIEGFEPIPVGIIGGMKIYSQIIDTKSVDISIGFNEFNVIFLKAINTENNLIGRQWSTGVAFYTNDLTLLSNNDTNENGKTMQEYYIDTVADFGILLQDLVERSLPRNLGIVPNTPVLTDSNFRTIQVNKYLTDTPDLAKNRNNHEQSLTLRSKIDEINKTLQQKREELFGKRFKSKKDKLNVENQITKLEQDATRVTESLNSTINEILANNRNSSLSDPEYRVQGFWNIPVPKEDGKTRSQEVIAFRIQYKFSNTDGVENPNEPFNITQEDGTELNAVFSPWKDYTTSIKERVYDTVTQKYVWSDEDLSSIDKPNINSVNIKIRPNEQVLIRVKAISEVGFPDSILESPWSNTLAITFDDSLLEGNNPQLQFIKNAELEDIRNKIESDLNRKGLDQHLSDSQTIEDKFYAHDAENLAIKDSQGRLISLTEKMRQLEQADNVEKQQELILTNQWANYGNNYADSKFYRHEGRVHLQGLIRIDKGDEFENPKDRYPSDRILIFGKQKKNTEYSIIGTLPEGYRPSQRMIFNVATSSDLVVGTTANRSVSEMGRIDIFPDGVVMVAEGNTTWTSLNNISFRI